MSTNWRYRVNIWDFCFFEGQEIMSAIEIKDGIILTSINKSNSMYLINKREEKVMREINTLLVDAPLLTRLPFTNRGYILVRDCTALYIYNIEQNLLFKLIESIKEDGTMIR